MRPKKIYPTETDRMDAEALDRHSPIPLYQQLSDRLARGIQQGVFKPGEALPSEYDLIHRYGVSRYVVRQALANVSRHGLIHTEQGRGSFVSYPRVEKSLSLLQSYHKNMRDAGLPVEVAIVNKQLCLPGPEVAEKLHLQPDQHAFHMERVAYHDNNPVNLLITDIALPEPQLQLLEKFPGGSLYAYLGAACHVSLHHAQSYLDVIFAGEQESRLLNLPRGSVLMQITSWVFSSDDRPLEFTRIIYPATMFRFYFDSLALVSTPDATQS